MTAESRSLLPRWLHQLGSRSSEARKPQDTAPQTALLALQQMSTPRTGPGRPRVEISWPRNPPHERMLNALSAELGQGLPLAAVGRPRAGLVDDGRLTART